MASKTAEMAERFATFLMSKAKQWRLADKIKESMKAVANQ
jgi:ABC-type thiamine transport system substrate-binding protein